MYALEHRYFLMHVYMIAHTASMTSEMWSVVHYGLRCGQYENLNLGA
jgi:hypothetical protein